jgi:hypothetical protein
MNIDKKILELMDFVVLIISLYYLIKIKMEQMYGVGRIK